MFRKTKVCLEKTQKQYMKQVNKGQRQVKHEEGQKV